MHRHCSRNFDMLSSVIRSLVQLGLLVAAAKLRMDRTFHVSQEPYFVAMFSTLPTLEQDPASASVLQF